MKSPASRRWRLCQGRRRTAVVLLTMALGCMAHQSIVRAATSVSVASAISVRLASVEAPVQFPSPDHGARSALGAVYAHSDDRPLWSVSGGATRQALELIAVLRHAETYGLQPRDYGGDALAALMRRARAAPERTQRWARLWAKFDLELSAQALRLVCDLHYGRAGTRTADLDLVAVVRSLAHSNNLKETLAAIEPTFDPYRRLKRALAKYLRIAAQDPALTVLPPLPRRSVRLGETYRGAAALRKLLRAVGDLPAAAASSSTDFDATLARAVEHFQRRHELAPDGVLGPATFRQLTTPMAVRVRQIELALERWRWLPRLHAPLIIVNIPQFRLFAYRTTTGAAAPVLQMKVIVGRTVPRARTPVFVGDMTAVVFRPYWNVPRSITLREMLPNISAKPRFLVTEHLQIVRGDGDAATPVPPTAQNVAALAAGGLRLRQMPGRKNALGRIKFVVPNRYSVFLHSTPARWLFREPHRAFSHGCVRLSDPVALAVYVLRDTPGDWSRAKIEEAMNGKDNQYVVLAKPVHVVVLYQTVSVTGAGDVLFFDDLYGRDRRLARRLGLGRAVRDASLASRFQ